jgi:cytochrome c oxidase subunit 1
MLLFSLPNHLTGLAGMPRRIYQFDYGASPVADQWSVGTGLSALGGVLLFVSAFCFVAVMFGTLLAGPRAPQPPVEFAEPLGGPSDKAPVLDKLWIWVTLAVLLVVAAYAWPIAEHLSMPRFGSRGFSPF